MREALLVIDLQESFFTQPENELYNADALVRHVNRLIDTLRARGVEILFVQHDDADPADPLYPGKPSWALHAGLYRQPGDTVVRKRHNDAFCETELHEVLQKKGITTLHFAGAQTELCLDTSIRGAYAMGYRDNIVYKNAHSTRDNPVLKAPQIIAHHQHIWSGRFATLADIPHA